MAQTLSVVTTQFYKEQGSKHMRFTVGQPVITALNYAPASDAEIRSYEKGIYTDPVTGEDLEAYYAMVDVEFDLIFRNGGEDMTQGDYEYYYKAAQYGFYYPECGQGSQGHSDGCG